MLGNIDAQATVAVRDLDAARKFYEETLGLEPAATEGDELVAYRAGATSLNVYRSKAAGTNKATAVNWDVGERIEEIVQDLSGRGVRFEHYDLPGMKREGDLHVAGGMKAAWFKDPDGNIFSLTGR